MGSKTIATMVRKLRSEQAKLAKTRDALREILSEYEAVAEDAEAAIESLEDAIDALSRMQ